MSSEFTNQLDEHVINRRIYFANRTDTTWYSMPVIIDEKRPPLIAVRFEGAPTEGELIDFLQLIQAYYHTGQVFALRLDLTDAKTPPARQMNVINDFARKNAANDRMYSLGVAYVIRSGVIRAFIKAILLVFTPASPYIVTESLEGADAWLQTKLGGQQRR